MLQLFTDNIEDMYNCLKMPTSQFRKLLASLFVFVALIMSAAAQAATYWWIGGATGNWNDATNWASTEGGAAGTRYPGDTPTVTNDEVHIYGNVGVTIASDISIGKLLIQSGTNSLTSNFTTSLSGTGRLTVTDNSDAAINITRCASDNPASITGTLVINLPLTCSGTIQTHSGTTLNIASGKNLETVNLVHSAYGDSPKTELQVNGTLTVTDTLNLNAMGSGATQLIVSSDGLVDAKNITFGSATYSNTGAASAIVNNGTIKVSNAFTIPDLSLSPYTGSGTIQLDGSGTGASFTNNYTSGNITIEELQGLQTATVSGGGHTSITTATFSDTADISGSTITNATFLDDITLSGENTFQNFTAIGLGGKTLTVNAEQTFQSGGTVTLSGTGDSNLLTVTGNGSGKFTLGTSILTGEYLSLDTDSNVTSASTGTIFAQNSQTTGSGTTNWIVTSAGGHLWNGENGDWEEVSNWIPQTLPAATDEVIINSDTPKINSTVTVKSITVNGGGINLQSDSLSVENLTLAASTSVSTAASTIINITEDQEIDEKITGAGKLVLVSGKSFTIAADSNFNINIENKGTLSSAGDVTFSKDFTNSGTATFTGGISLAGDIEDTGTFSGAITFNGSENQSFTPKSSTAYTEINIRKASGVFSVTGDLTVTKLTLDDEEVSVAGNLTLGNGTQFTGNNQITSTGDISFTKELDAGNNLTVSASGDVSFAETFSSTGDLSITATSGAVSFTGQCNISGDFSVTSNTLTFGDSVSVKDFTIDSTTTTSSDITVRGKWTNNKASNGFTASGGTVKLTTDSSDTSRVTLSGTNTFHNLNLDRNVSVLGSNTINQDLIMHINSGDAAGKGNIYFAAGTKQTINGKIDFKGLTSKSLLAACGNESGTTNGTWEIEYGTAEVQNVNLSGCKNSSTQAVVVADPAGTETNGKSIDGGGNTNFIFLGHSYTWNGETSSNWNTAENWSPSSIPGKGSEITLPAGKTNYPVLAAELNLNYDTTYKGSILIEDGASFDLAGENLTVGAITNNGKVLLTGAETITASMSNGTNTNSTVEYYDTTSTLTIFQWDGGNTTTPSYNNLIILKPVNSTQKISVSGTVKIGTPDETSPSNNINAGSVTLKSDSPITLEDNVFADILDFDCEAKIKNIKVTDSVTFEKPVTLLSNSKITSAAGNKIHFKNTVTGNSFNLTTETGNSQFDDTISGINNLTTDSSVTFGGDVSAATISAEAATINCSNIETSSNGQTFDGTVSILNNVILKAPENKLIYFKDSVSGSSSVDLTIDTGNSQFDGDVNIGSLSTKAATINCSNIETTSNGQTFDGTVTLQNSVTFKVPVNKLIYFKSNVSGSGAVDLTTDTGNSQFDGEISNLVSLSTAATATFNNNINIGTLSAQTTIINCEQITTSGNQTYNDTITLNENVILTTGNSSSITFGNDITGTDKTLTLNTTQLISSIAAGATPANINLDTLALSRDIKISSINAAGINLNISSISGTSKTLSFAGNTTLFQLKNGIDIDPAVENNKSIYCLGAATFKDNFTNTNGSLSGDTTGTAILTFEKDYSGAGTSTLTASKGQTIFNGNVDLSSTNFIHSDGSVILKTASGGGTNSATLKTGTGKTFNDLLFERQVKLEGTGTNTITSLTIKDSVEILCSNTIGTFTADTPTGGAAGSGLGGKTITFGAGTTQEVSVKITLHGSANTDGNRLNLRSSNSTTTSATGTPWKINCTGSNEHDIKFVDIQDSSNITSSYYLFALNSIDHGNNTKWNFPGMQYKWTGADSSDPTNWNVAGNWENLSIPGKGAYIEIPAGCTNYPKLVAELNLNDSYGTPPVAFNGKITVASNAQFDLTGQNLTLDEIINSGLVRLTGASGQTISGIMKNEEGSTVEYYGTGATTTNFAWDGDNGSNTSGKQYENLILNQDTSSSESLLISKSLKINNPANLSGIVKVTGSTTISAGSGKTVSLNNDSNVFTGTVKAGDSNPSAAVNAGAVTLKASSPITLENNANADSLEIQSAVKLQNVTTSGNQSYSGTVETITGTAALKSTFGNISFGNPVTLGVPTSVTTSMASGIILFENSATINGAQSLSISSTGGTTLGANIGNTTPLSTLTVTGPLNVNCGIINTSGKQTYKGAVTLGVESNITSTAGDISIESTGSLTVNADSIFTVSTSGKEIDFSGVISGTSKLTTAGSGTAIFNNTVNVASLETQAAKINTSTIETNGSQNYKGPVVLAANTNLTSTTNGDITFNSTLDGDKLITLTVPLTKSISVTGKTGASTTLANPPSITIAQTGTINFKETVKVSSFTLTKANSTTFAKAVDITSFSDDTSNHTGSIIFSDGGTISNDVSFNTNNTVSFTGTMNIGTEGSRKNLVHTNGSTFTSGIINASTTQIADLTLTGNTTITTNGTQNYSGTINDTTASAGTHSLTLNSATALISLADNIGQTAAPADLTVNGPIAINCSYVKTTKFQRYNSTISSNGSTNLQSEKIELKCGNITTEGNQTYDGHVVFESNNEFTSNIGDIHFKSTLSCNHNLTLNKANNTTFDGSVEIASFTDNENSGNITFKNGGRISASEGTTFLTTGLLTLGDAQTDITTFGSTSSDANLTHTAGNTSITGNIKAANITLAETSGGPMIITNSGLFVTQDNKALSYTTSFTQNGTGNSKLGGSFSGNGPATFVSSLQLYGSSSSNFGTAGTNISIAKNLIITREATDSLTILSNVNITENLVLYKSPVLLNANISTGKDTLILGSSYSTTDSSTKISNEYAYTTPRHEEWSQPSYSETSLPDGSNLPDTYTATLTVGANCCLTTGKNFYANGTSLTTEGANGQWLLKLPDLTNPANGFAEAYHSVVSGCKVVCNAETSEADTDGSKARLATLECTDAGSDATPNTNIEFDDFEIVNAYTVRDNAIRIEFNRPIRYHASTINSLKFHNASSLPDCDFSAFYSTPDCTEESELKSDITMSYFNEDDNKTYYYFYIKASAQNNANLGAWNTDATSKTAGYSEKSSDRNGVHHDTLPCLDFPRSLKNDDGSTLSFIFTDIWGQRLKNYSLRPDPLALEPAYGSDASSYEVLDKTGPVLWTLRSGQENHNAYDSSKGQESQHSYDAHNFIEFRYSEPVNFGSADTSICDINIPVFTDDTNTEINLAENIQVTDIFGAVQEDISTPQNTMTFAGLAKITATGSSLCLHTGTEGKASKYMNALYRTDEYSLRLSIAGWTDSTVADYNGNLYKNWPGYIEEASQFTDSKASAVAETNPLVCDLNGNIQIEYPVSPTEPLILSNADNLLFTPDPNIYGQWDLSSPVFAPLRFNAKLAWSDCPDTDTSEAVGNTNGSGSTLDRIEFHFFDNTPLYNSQDPAEWFTEVGWCNPGSNPTRENLKDSSYTYASDIIGGARQFDTDSKRRTSGGIRFSTKATSSAGFLYSKNASNMNPQTPFKEGIENVHTSTTSPLFTGSSSPRHPVNDPDSLYLGIGITDSNLPVESTFSFAYSDTKAYVTDLAGNRLRSKVSKTIDRTPPSFDIVLSPVGNNEMFIIFVKQIVTDSAELRLTSNEGEVIQISEDFMSLLPDCFQIISIDQDGNYSPSEEIKIDTSVPASLIPSHTSENFTTVRLALTQNVSIENVKNLYIQLKQNSNYPETSQDPFTSNKNSNVTLIQDSLGNYMGMYSAHALSDFAINSVTPLYAYASDMQYNDENVMEGLYGQGSWAVHDWNEDQQNYGTLPYGYDTQLVAESSSTDPMRLYLSEKPDAESVASQFNEDFSTKLRIWLPEVKDGIFSALTSSNNKNYVSSDSTYLNNENSENLSFYISADTIKKWSPGDQVSFIFGLLDDSDNPYRIYDSPYYDVGSGLYNLSLNNPVPLYCFRMHNPSDISTIDLWSFRLKDITNQRGGITILNNVINADLGEKTVLKVNMPTDGNLNIAVLTLDGNIITYLNKGRLSEGEHWFTWNGKNRNGTSVARGMYFIRISGSGIDETRKVMVIK